MKKSLFLITMTIILCSTIQVNAQSESSTDIKQLGMGLHIEQFKISDLTMDLYTAPANKIIFTITPLSDVRFEPEIGYIYI